MEKYYQLRIVLRTDFMNDSILNQLKEDLISELSHVCTPYRGIKNIILFRHERGMDSIKEILKNFYSKNLDKILYIRDFQHSSLTELNFIF